MYVLYSIHLCICVCMYINLQAIGSAQNISTCGKRGETKQWDSCKACRLGES